MDKTYFFVSDTHFKYNDTSRAELKKREIFFEFLKEIKGAAGLYLVGDIFDFWFEYRYSFPGQYFDICRNLNALRESGTEIFITGGNHDYWLGHFISDIIQIHILPELSIHELQGRRIAITHGDMLIPGDRGYKILKKVIRNRLIIRLARMVHPDILFGFARKFSSTSKEITPDRTDYWAARVTDMAEEMFFRWNNDIFIMGHIHKNVLKSFGKRTFGIPGGCEGRFTYLFLNGGELMSGYYSEEGKTFIEKR